MSHTGAPPGNWSLGSTSHDLYSLVETQNAHYGSLIRARYGGPFFTHETVAVDDVLVLDVQSM